MKDFYSSQSSFQHSLASGIYYVEFISNGSSTSYLYPYTFLIQNTLSLDENIVSENILAYPNPFSNQLTIETNEPIYKVEIYNLLGQLVKIFEFNNPNATTVNLDLEEIAQGNYIAKVSSEYSINTIKLIKN
jgi:hypothetical protein